MTRPSVAGGHFREKVYRAATGGWRNRHAFMGAFLAPIHRVYARLCYHCGRLGLSPSDLRQFDPEMLSNRIEKLGAAAAISRQHYTLVDRRLRAVDEFLTRLARDFGVTRRFMAVRLMHYRFMGQDRAAA